MTRGVAAFRLHQHIELISFSSVLPSSRLLFDFCGRLFVSFLCWRLPNDYLSAGKASGACHLLFLPHRVNSASSLSSLLLFPAAALMQTILEEDLEDPVYQVTSCPITLLLSPAALKLVPFGVHCGETAAVCVGSTTLRSVCGFVCMIIEVLCIFCDFGLRRSHLCITDNFPSTVVKCQKTVWLTTFAVSPLFSQCLIFQLFLCNSFFALPSPFCCWCCSTLCLRRDTSPSMTNQKKAYIRYSQALPALFLVWNGRCLTQTCHDGTKSIQRLDLAFLFFGVPVFFLHIRGIAFGCF